MDALFSGAMPIRGFGGGLIIGAAAAIMLLGPGRVAGVSGLLARTIGIARGAPWPAAAAFILGLPSGMLAVAAALPVETAYPRSVVLLVAAGLLVGYGTRLGSGCTSGHGVCGLSRLSPRSLAAVVIFMLAGIATATAAGRLGIVR